MGLVVQRPNLLVTCHAYLIPFHKVLYNWSIEELDRPALPTSVAWLRHCTFHLSVVNVFSTQYTLVAHITTLPVPFEGWLDGPWPEVAKLYFLVCSILPWSWFSDSKSIWITCSTALASPSSRSGAAIDGGTIQPINKTVATSWSFMCSEHYSWLVTHFLQMKFHKCW